MENNKKKLSKTLLVLFSYTIVFGAGTIFGKLKLSAKCEQPSLTTNVETTSKETSHIAGNIKKKDAITDASGAVLVPATTEISFVADVEKLFGQSASVKMVLPEYKKRDNFKLNINSKVQIGLEIQPKDHHWLGYSKDLRTGENIYQYSWSNRFEIPFLDN